MGPANVQTRLCIFGGVRGAIWHEHQLVLPVQLPGAVPVQRAIERVSEVAVNIKVQLLCAKQGRILRHAIEQLEGESVAARVEGRSAIGERGAIDSIENLPHARGVLCLHRTDVVLNRVRAELELVVQRGQGGGLVDVGGSWGSEGRADDEEGCDEVWVPEGGAVNDSSAPVVSAEDDAGEAEMAGEGGDVI